MWQFPETLLDQSSGVYFSLCTKMKQVVSNMLEEKFPVVSSNGMSRRHEIKEYYAYLKFQQLALLDILKDDNKKLQLRMEVDSIPDDGSGVNFPFNTPRPENTLEICVRHIRRGYTYTKHITPAKSSGELMADIERQKGVEQTLQINRTHVIRVFSTPTRVEILTSFVDATLLQKIMALYPVFFAEHFLPNNERTLCRDIINSIALGKSEEALTACARYTELHPMLKNAEKAALMNTLRNAQQTELRNIAANRDASERTYKEKERLATDYFNKYLRYQRDYELLEQSDGISEDMQDLIDYIYKHPLLKDITVSANAGVLELNVISPLKFYETEIMEHNYMRTQRWGDSGQIILQKIFKDEEYQVLTQSRITFNLLNGSIGRDTNYGQDRNYFKQPHIEGHGCWGNHNNRIRDRWANGDKIGAFEQVMYACQNINFSDGVVIGTLKNSLLDNPNKKSIKDVATGELVSVNDIVTRERSVPNENNQANTELQGATEEGIQPLPF